jgi:hypothetical protein
MKAIVSEKLSELRADYEDVRGQPFSSFFCPILFEERADELCQAHIVNKAFDKSSRAWTVQVKDVDGFYGSRFESSFVDITYTVDGRTAGDSISDANLMHRMQPKLRIGDKDVRFFVPKRGQTTPHPIVRFENQDESINLGLKVGADELEDLLRSSITLSISKDIRIESLVSLIKAAHLTLFETLRYKYALSASGHFVGRTILGEFYIENRDIRERIHVLDRANKFFRPYRHMMRPIIRMSTALSGSIDDGVFMVCEPYNNQFWCIIVFVRTSSLLHAVLFPIFDSPDGVYRYLKFLEDDVEVLVARFCRYDRQERQWEISPTRVELNWPKGGILYPD